MTSAIACAVFPPRLAPAQLVEDPQFGRDIRTVWTAITGDTVRISGRALVNRLREHPAPVVAITAQDAAGRVVVAQVVPMTQGRLRRGRIWRFSATLPYQPGWSYHLGLCPPNAATTVQRSAGHQGAAQWGG